MKKALNQIMKEQGMQALMSPQQLREDLITAGADVSEAITLELILQSCPSITASLATGELSWAEGNVLVSSVVRSTALSPAKVRQILGTLFLACGAKISSIPSVLPGVVRKTKFDGTVSSDMEENRLKFAWQQVQNKENLVEALTEIENIAKAGNAYAYYLLGEYYHADDRKNSTENGKVYYETAAELGYSPAYGALADYEVNGRKRNLRKAADYFTHPAALAGADGRQWSVNAQHLLDYRGENKIRIQSVVELSILVFVAITLTIAITNFSVLTGLALLIAGFCVFRAVFAWVFAPYQSQRNTYILLFVCWLLMAAALL